MAKKSTYKASFRRRKEGKTNYKKRLALLKSKAPRLVARKTNKNIIAQVIEYDSKGDKTLVHVNSSQLEAFGWEFGKKSLSSAYLTGLLAGTKAKKAKVEKANLDIGFAIPKRGGWWASVLKGAKDAGLDIKAGENAMPSEERVKGKHIEDYAKQAEKPKGVFSKADPKDITKKFEEAKQKILQSK